ncbi:mannose-6-phosphate receptor binding domain-containing protein [Geopyxis carbonaria]|nr:mannose-6-phosphate receptor binding domain-containing protein [Geopyxis carbonaria]
MRLPTAPLLLLAAIAAIAAASPDDPKKPAKDPDPACTVTSVQSENFFDLRPLQRVPDHAPPHHDWLVKGQDYGANFSINICGPVLAAAGARADGVPAGTNVSAFYEMNGTVYSIGSTSTAPRFRGRKLVLAYDNGSPCPGAPGYRKSTLMSLMCDHEAFHKPSVAFVGAVNDCAYFFEVRTSAACATINRAQALGPVAVFGVIMGVAAMVYCVGGCVYQRTVMHARGWRQIPHYGAWAAALGFVWDLLNSLWTSLIEHLPLPSSLPGSGGARGVDVENRLIDSLDDDWGDNDEF